MIVPFKINHLDDMKLDDSQLTIGRENTKVAYQSIQGPAMTLICNGNVIASGGITRLWPGLGEGWAIISSDVFGCPITFHRYAMRLFPQMMEEGKFHRVQATVLAGFEKGIRWVRALGMSYEGILIQYGPNKETYYRYVILR